MLRNNKSMKTLESTEVAMNTSFLLSTNTPSIATSCCSIKALSYVGITDEMRGGTEFDKEEKYRVTKASLKIVCEKGISHEQVSGQVHCIGRRVMGR